VDVFGNDLGLIAIVENESLLGFNLAIGGGLSSTHGNPSTYPRLATVIGFIPANDKLMKVVYEVLTIQRDFGNRSDRKQARLKYTIDNMGVNAFKSELELRCGFPLDEARPYQFTERKDYYGWRQNNSGKWHYTIFVENGRVVDDENLALKTALLKVAETGLAQFRFTPNQNLILSDIDESDKNEIEGILNQFGIIAHTNNSSLVRKNSIACVAFNTCPLALAEAQRYLPTLITKIEPLLKKHGLDSEEISLRMTGCPNGCGRSPLAEIGFIGTAYGRYNLYLGGDRFGERLNQKFRDNLDEQEILTTLDEVFSDYSLNRSSGETLGDFAWRKYFEQQ
jgi:sulfite reductase (NADPH) hemoprotein beta-component